MAKLLERVEALFEDDGIGSDSASGGVLALFEVLEDLLALLMGLVGEKQSAVAFQVLPLHCYTYDTLQESGL